MDEYLDIEASQVVDAENVVVVEDAPRNLFCEILCLILCIYFLYMVVIVLDAFTTWLEATL
jgi:hypothetical protein